MLLTLTTDKCNGGARGGGDFSSSRIFSDESLCYDSRFNKEDNPASKSAPYFCSVYVISKGVKISSMRHARGAKRGVKRDRSVSSSVGSSTTLPPAKARKIKDRPRVRKHFKLHRKVFKKCEHNHPVSSAESTMLGLKSKRSSQKCSTSHSKSSSDSGRSPVSETKLEYLWDTATELSVLLREDKITLGQVARALDKFKDGDIPILWLKMSLENKIKYLKSLR